MMADNLSNFHGLTRSQLMSRIRSRGNKKTEIALATLFKKNRITGWRRHYFLVGTPDFVFLSKKVAVFVDGCFWHGCKSHFKMPATRTEFWRAKVERNKARDKNVARLLKAAGWKVIRIWEHDLQKRNQDTTLRRILGALA